MAIWQVLVAAPKIRLNCILTVLRNTVIMRVEARNRDRVERGETVTIQELSRRAGVTPRTIRYYVEQGLLPPPGRGRPAEYTEEHLRRLALIRKLKRQYLPLEEIRDTMQKLGIEQVEELLAQGEQTEPPHTGMSSAADYIRGIMERTEARETYKRHSVPPPPPAPTIPVQPRPAPAAEPPASAPSLGRTLKAPPPATNGSAENGIREPAVSYTEGDLESQAETWRRVKLAEGIELHYLPAPGARRGELVARLLDAAKQILGKHPEKETEK